MKTLTDDELDSLNNIKRDIEITLESNFSEHGNVFLRNLLDLNSIFTTLYFKLLNHNPDNKNWKNRDIVFATNRFTNIVKLVTEVHAGYTSFDLLKNYLSENNFLKSENSFSEAIGNYMVSREMEDNHIRYYYVIMSDIDAFSNLISLEFISKNNMSNIITILYTKTDNEYLNEENKLNTRLIGLGFDTLIVSGVSILSISDAVIYAKKLNKPTVILANIN